MERYRRSLDAFNRRDLDAILALMDDQVEVGSRQVAIEGGYHGHEGLRRWGTDLFDAIPDYTAEMEELHDLGDAVLMRIRAEAQSAHGDTTSSRNTEGGLDCSVAWNRERPRGPAPLPHSGLCELSFGVSFRKPPVGARTSGLALEGRSGYPQDL